MKKLILKIKELCADFRWTFMHEGEGRPSVYPLIYLILTVPLSMILFFTALLVLKQVIFG